MTQYFYSEGAERRGPVPLSDLRAAGITPATLVWYEGLPDWKPASDFPELSDLFLVRPATDPPPSTPPAYASVPPPPPPQPYAPAAPGPRRNAYDQLGGPPPKTYLLESILVTVLCCLPLGIVGIVNASKVESRYYAGDIEQAQYYSREARKWSKYGLIGAVAGFVVYFAFVVLIGFGGSF